MKKHVALITLVVVAVCSSALLSQQETATDKPNFPNAASRAARPVEAKSIVAFADPADVPEPLFLFDSEAKSSIRKLLDTKLTVSLAGVSFEEALKTLSRQSKCEIQVSQLKDDAALQELVSCERTEAPLWEILRHICATVGRDFKVVDAGVVIVEEIDPSEMPAAIYPCADLAGNDDQRDELVLLIFAESTCEWVDVDGAGGSAQFIQAGESILVRHRVSTHKEVASILHTLRLAKLSQRQLSEKLQTYQRRIE